MNINHVRSFIKTNQQLQNKGFQEETRNNEKVKKASSRMIQIIQDYPKEANHHHNHVFNLPPHSLP